MTDRLQYRIVSAIDPTTAEHRFVIWLPWPGGIDSIASALT
jgi:hypothetical protein